MALFLAEAYLHRLDPFAVRFPSGWPLEGVRWYGLAYLAGFGLAWLIVRWMVKHHRTALPARVVPDLMIAVLIGVLVGGRVGYAVFYDRTLFFKFSSSFPFWDLLAITRGGMSSHGGMIGVVAALWIFAVRNRLSKLHLMDVGCLASPPGLFLGRLANFVNGELWGRALPERMQVNPPWWAIKYPAEIELWKIDALPPDKVAALKSAAQTLGYGAGELHDKAVLEAIVTALRAGNHAVIEHVQPVLTAYYPSQILQAITDGPLLFLLLVIAWWGPRKPGVVGATFLIGYGVMRIFSERFREPDAGIPLLHTPLEDLSRGQSLSVLMVAIGVIGLIIVARREVDPIGGLVRTGRN